MEISEYSEHDATGLAELIRTGQVSAEEVQNAARAAIESVNQELNALVGDLFDAPLGANAGGPFAGVPFAIKDLVLHAEGIPQRIGSRLLGSGVTHPEDSALMRRFREAGLAAMGVTATPEFGFGATTESVANGPTLNPWDTSRSPGGSSGGSAALVAARALPIAHASDGGGSIRIPASCCGLVGLKPSQGRITHGPDRDESGLSVQHCVSRTVRDTAALLDATRGPGIGDTVIAPAPTRPYVEELGADPGRLRIGILDHHPHGGPVDAEVVGATQSVATLLETLGHHVEAGWPKALEDSTFGSKFGALWSTNMGLSQRRFEELLGRPLKEDEFEPMNRVQADFAKHLTAVDYGLALSAVTQYRRAVQSWWHDGWDLLLTPTVAEVPIPLGTIVNDPEHPMSPMERAGQFVAFTPPFNASGQPAISLPLEWTAKGLPVGVQLVAAYGREDVLIRVASQLERAKPWVHRTPDV